MDERAMFPVIKAELKRRGFEVQAEVTDVDIVAMKNKTPLIVEMKQALSITLIYQGIKRMTMSDYVYLAIPKPTDKVLKSRNFKEKKAIVRYVGLGLMLVDLEKSHITYILDPATRAPAKDARRTRKMHEEFALRKTALNEAGVTKTKIITAYRELALRILDCLRDGPQPIKALVATTKDIKTARILQDNHYGWFERVERGVYQMTKAGTEALTVYADVLQAMRPEDSKENHDT